MSITYNDLKERAQIVLAGGPGTFSKHWSVYPEGVAPFALVSGEDSCVVGSDGRTYLDTTAALGAVVLGYSHPAVNVAVMEQIEKGCSFGMVHPLEIEVAEQLCTLIPCAEMVRFMRNGTDATNTAVRLARAITGRDTVLWCGYHGGGGDSYGSTTTRNAGILPEIQQYNMQIIWEQLERVILSGYRKLDDVAAVMIEVPALAWGTPEEEYAETLQAVAKRIHEVGGLFLLDEVVSFPRASLYGVQTIYGLTPDLCCVSKGMGNGMPIAALVGQRQYMERLNKGDVFASWTFAGETTALAATKTTLTAMGKEGSGLLEAGEIYGNALQEVFMRNRTLPVKLYGHPWRLVPRWSDTKGASGQELRTLWAQEHCKRGIIHHPLGAQFPMTCWSDKEVEFLVNMAEEVCEVMSEGLKKKRIQKLLEVPVSQDILPVRTV